jgi:glutamyl endopeptidase
MSKAKVQNRIQPGFEGRADVEGDRNGHGTEYEEVSGLKLNLDAPDTECSNAEALLGAEATAYEGFAGEETSWDTGEVLDAIHGSYDLPESEVQEVIIGTDDRIRVHSTGSYPWRAICALRMTAANGRRFIGTGWMISPRTVITAGHCVFMHNEGGWARTVEVIPGLNDASRPYGSCSSSQLRSVTGWTQSRDRRFDYGAIILPANCRLGEQTGWFGFANRNDAFLQTAKLNLSGYPGDKGGSQQWFMAERTKFLTDRIITYEIDTMGGQSGSPVWVLQNNVRYAVGIHTNGHFTGNSATRIQSNVFERLEAWRQLGL